MTYYHEFAMGFLIVEGRKIKCPYRFNFASFDQVGIVFITNEEFDKVFQKHIIIG